MASVRTRRLRWSAPVLVGAIVAVIAAVPGLSAAGTPALAPLTPAQLIAKIAQTKVTAFSGTLNLSPNLGIPNLSALTNAAGGGGHDGQGFNPTALLSGSQKALIWVAGPTAERVALLGDMAETDVVHNGQNIWLWDSTTKKVTHFTRAPSASAADKPADAPAATEPVKTPQQVADDLLAHLDSSTWVTVGAPLAVAKHQAYRLILTPKTGSSTVDHVAISVDSTTGFPLQVQVFAQGQKAAAITLGFGSVNFATPAASNFSFTPPPGSTVTEKTVGGSKTQSETTTPHPDKAGAAGQPTIVGQGWTSVAIFNNVVIPRQLNQFLMAGSSVTGSFGSGKMLQTALVNILVLNDGRVAVGAVNVSTLEAAISSAH